MFTALWWVIWIFCLIRSIRIWFTRKQHVIVFSYSQHNVSYKHKITMCEIICLLSVFLLITANRNGFDIINYCNTYNHLHDFSLVRESLYRLLRLAGYNIGLTFYEFRAILTFVAGVVLVSCCKKQGVDMCIFLAFYMPSMLFMDSMQVRNALCIWLLLYSIKLFLDTDDKVAWIKYTALVVILAQIHTGFYIYLIFLFLFFKERHICAGVIACVGIVLALLTWLSGNQLYLLQQILGLILNRGDQRLDIYSVTANNGFIIPTVIHIVTMIVLFLIYKSAEKQKKENMITANMLQLVYTVYLMNQLIMIVLPIVAMNLTFYRLLRNIFYFDFVAVIALLQETRSAKRRGMILLGLFLITIMWFVFDIIIYPTSPIIEPVLEGELFFIR